MTDLFTGSIEAIKVGNIKDGKDCESGKMYLELTGSCFKIHEKSGRYFLNFMYEEMKEETKEKAFGSTHYISVTQSKEEREAKLQRKYIGNGKHWINTYNNQEKNEEQKKYVQEEENDSQNLPF